MKATITSAGSEQIEVAQYDGESDDAFLSLVTELARGEGTILVIEHV